EGHLRGDWTAGRREKEDDRRWGSQGQALGARRLAACVDHRDRPILRAGGDIDQRALPIWTDAKGVGMTRTPIVEGRPGKAHLRRAWDQIRPSDGEQIGNEPRRRREAGEGRRW